MPALSKIEHASIARLAEELRFTPKATLLKHISRIEELALIVERDGVFPEDFIVFRVTGYRPEMSSPALIPGDTLRRDLSALCERLCESAGLGPEDIDTSAIGIDALAERWGVSRKSIERYRKDGLVARRVDLGSGRRSIVFTSASVEAFEHENEAKLGHAESFTRLNSQERAKCVRWSARYARSLGWNRTRCAERVAERLGRSKEAVRVTIREHDEQCDDPLFVRRSRSDAQQRAELLDQSLLGELRADGTSALQGADTSTLTRLVDRARSERIAEVLQSRHGMLRRDSQTDPETHKLNPNDPLINTDLLIEGTQDLGSLIAMMREERPQNLAAQNAQSDAIVTLLTRSDQAARALNPARPSAGVLDMIETDLRWVMMLRLCLLRSQFTLILSTIEQRLGGSLEAIDASRASEIILQAIDTSHDAVCGYDPSHGGRLSARVGLSLSRFAARIQDKAEPAQEGKAARRLSSAYAIEDWTQRVWDTWSWLRPPQIRQTGSIQDDAAKTLLTRRYGLGGQRPISLSEISIERGTTLGAMRRVERSVLKTLSKFTRQSD